MTNKERANHIAFLRVTCEPMAREIEKALDEAELRGEKRGLERAAKEIKILQKRVERLRSALSKMYCECGYEEPMGEGYTNGVCLPCQALMEDDKE